MSLLEEMNQKATALGIPLSAHLDITWRCNERCVHCYLDHDAPGEMTTEEIKSTLRQLAESGTFFLSISGGEPLLRRDCFEILEYARKLRFNAKQAVRLKELGIEQVQISIYSHRPEVHDAITKLPGSLRRSLDAIERLKENGLKVSISNVMMRQNYSDSKSVQVLAKELGVDFHIDPTITPKLNGDRSILNLGISDNELREVFRTEDFVGNVDEFCAPAPAADDSVLDGYSCSAGHTLIYISPFGDVYPCVQFPMPCGNVRKDSIRDIWYGSSALTELRSVHVRDLPTCSSCSHVSSCSRCPGLAYMEGNMRGPSSADCAKSEARMGFDGKKPGTAMKTPGPMLVQITLPQPMRIQ
jgi:radical SAM protein with 4Fe4S-binding SPASM domain